MTKEEIRRWLTSYALAALILAALWLVAGWLR
jgi:type VI protein secretion system component VasK